MRLIVTVSVVVAVAGAALAAWATFGHRGAHDRLRATAVIAQPTYFAREAAAARTPEARRAAIRRAAEREREVKQALHEEENVDKVSEMLVIAALAALLGGLVVLGFALVRSRREVAMTRRKELDILERAARTDSLTGLGNHRACQDDLRRQLERHRLSGKPLSVIRLDLRGLKQVNDSMGHQAGDARLCALADRLRETMRDEDGAYRTGGDEFTLILPDTRAWDAFQFAQRLRANALKGNPPVSFGSGITEAAGLEDVTTIVRRADLALIDSKRSKRGSVIFTDGLEDGFVERSGGASNEHYKLLATSLARAVDAKDAGTRNHCETVAELCVLIARELELPPEHIEKLRIAGLLHDVGKIGISDAVLLKPEPLDEDESATMRTHVTIGHTIVSAAGLEQEAEWILHHHERVDGKGYPHGLGADNIPLESRIILVADAFEAITADRRYRRGRPESDALDELQRHAGTQFDPVCVHALARALLATGDAVDEDGEPPEDDAPTFAGMAAAHELLYE